MWRYSLSSNDWEHLSGHMSINTPSDFSSSPYPGGVYGHTMYVSW